MTTSAQEITASEQVSRTDLLLGRLGVVASLEDVHEWFNQRPVYVYVDGTSVATQAGQSALITLATLLRRAGFPVHVLGELDAVVEAGPFRGQHLADVLLRLGAAAAPSDGAVTAEGRGVLIGDVASTALTSLQLTWDGWVAGIRSPGTRMGERAGCALAPILAAALAVSEVFESHLGMRDACWRDITVSLWNPTAASETSTQGPALRWLPEQWMLVGLGHLGQAYAWCISHLPYPDDACELWLADDDFVSPANVSTGVLTDPEQETDAAGRPVRKTRLVAAAVERVGIRTRLLERRIHLGDRYRTDSPAIALIGVDNLETRRSLTDFSWPLCVDAGLGSGPSSFDTLAIHCFDQSSKASQEISAWAERAPTAPDTSSQLFERLRESGVDECGIVTLANQNVACAYVGMIAACLAVAEVLRRVNGGPASTAMSLALDAAVTRGDIITPVPLRAPLCEILSEPPPHNVVR